MSGVYSRGPVGQRLGVKDPARTFYPDQDGNWPSGIPGTAGDPTYTRPAGYWDGGPGSVDTVEYANTYTTDWSHPDASNPQDTSGLIADDGTVKSLLPPGSRSFILGPLVDGYVFNHGYDDFTRIGYIQKDTRQFVLLATISGHWNDTDPVYGGNPTTRVWDGTDTGFTTYNENFTLAMAQWFRNRMLNGKGITRNVSYYASGGIGQGGNPDPDAPDGSLGGNGPGGSGHGGSGAGAGGGDPDTGTPQGDPENGGWDPNDPPNAKDDKKDPQDDLNNKYGHLSDEELAELGYKRDKDGNIKPMTDEEKQEYEDEKALKEWRRKMADKFRKIFPHMNDTQLVNHLKKIGLWDQVYKVPEPNKAFEKGIDSAMAAAGRALRLKSASNMLSKYDDWLRGGAPGTVDVTDQIQQSSMNRLVKSVNSAEVQSVIQKAIDTANGPNANNPVNLSVSSAKTLADLQWELAADAVTKKLQKTVHGSLDLDNTLHNNVQIDRELFKQSGGKEIVIVKTYQFRPGGSVAKAENSPVGKFLMGMGIELDTMATGPVGWLGVAASMMGLRGSMMYGGNYSAPGMPMRINVKSGAGEKPQPSPWDVKNFKAGMFNSYEPQGKILSESARRQLREIKKPYVVQEQPVQKLRKYRPNFKGKFSPQNTPNVTASKQTDDAVKAKNSQGQAWSMGDKYWSGYETTERMNVIYDRLGHGQMAWDRIIDEAKEKNGWKNREIQEQLNIIAAEKAERQICSDYESPWGTVIHEQGASTEEELDTVMKDPLVKKVAKRLRTQIDYKDKPARKGYPDKPPAKQVNGWHPEYGKKYKYDKLDPVSAVTMRNAPTGDPEIDANVDKAAKKLKSKVKVKEDLSSWRNEIEIPEKKVEEEKKSLFRKIRQIELDEAIANSTSGVLSGAKHIPGAGDVDLMVLQTGLTGDGGIDYGEDGWTGSGLGNSTHTGDGEYTAITNLEPISTAPDPTNVGTGLRVVDFFNGLQSSSLDAHMKNIPGYKGEDIGRLIAVSGGNHGHINDPEYGKHDGVHEYTIDELGKSAPTYNNTDGLTDRGHGTYLIMKSGGAWAALKPVDTTEMDTIKFRASVHQNNLTDPSFAIQLYYWAGDKPGFQSIADPIYDGEASRPNDGWRPLYQKPDGTIDTSVSHIIIPDRNNRPPENHNVLVDYDQKIPPWCRGKDTRFLYFGKGYYALTSWGMTSVRFQRRNAITVGAPLDSPEASSFVRVGQGSADTTPEQRKKRVEEMLKASKLYMLKLLGYNDFPGMGATLDKVAASPTSFSDVWNIHARSLGNKAAAFRRAVSDRSQNYSSRPSSKSQNYSYKVTSKDSRGLTKTATARTPESVAEYERRQRWRSQNRK